MLACIGAAGLSAGAGPRIASPQTAPGATADSTIAAFVDAYYAALNAADFDAVFQLWHRDMPARGQMAGALVHQFTRERPTFSDVTITRTVIDGDRVRLTLALTVTATPKLASTEVTVGPTPAAGAPPPMPPGPPVSRRTVFILAREQAGEWRLFEEKSVVKDLADRLAATPDDEAADRFAAAEIFPEQGATLSVARTLLGAYGEAMAQQRYADAPRPIDRAMRLAEAGKARGDGVAGMFDAIIAQGWSSRGLLALYKRPTPEPERALDPFARALAIYEAAGDKTGIADVEASLATASYGIADYPRALAHWERARTLHQAIDYTQAVVRETLGIANVRFLFAQFDLAHSEYEQALALTLSEAAPDATPAAGMADSAIFARQGLGRVAVALGDYAGGRDHYVRALALIERKGSRDQQGPMLLEIGRTDFLRGRLDEARGQYAKALALGEELKDPTRQGDALQAIALVDAVSDVPDTAIATYTRSIDAYARATDKREATLGAAHALVGRGFVQLDRHDPDRALADFVEAQARFERVKEIEGAARAQLGQAMAHVRARRPTEAMTAADRAAAAAETLGLEDVEWQARLEAGHAWTLAGEAEKAKTAFDDAVRRLEESRLESTSDAATPARRAAPYAALVEWRIAHGDAAGALLAAEDAKRRLLEDLLQPHRARLTRGLDAARATEESVLIGRRVSLLAQIRRERDRATVDATRVATLQRSLQGARDASAQWQRDLLRDAPSVPFTRGEARLASFDALERSLPDDAALVHFVSSDEHLSVIIVTAKPAPVAAAAASDTVAASASSVPAVAPTRLDVRAYTRDIARGALAQRVWTFADAVAREGRSDGPSDGRSDVPKAEATSATPTPTPKPTPTATPAGTPTPASAGRAASAATAAAVTAVTTATAKTATAAVSGRAARPEASAPARPPAATPDAAPDEAVDVTLEAKALFELLLGPARAQIDGRSTLIIVPDDALWVLPFEALDTASVSSVTTGTPEASGGPRHLTDLMSITYLPSATTWLARPAEAATSPATPVAGGAAAQSDRSASGAVADAARHDARVLRGRAEIVEVSPLQSTIALASAPSSVSTPGGVAASPTSDPTATPAGTRAATPVAPPPANTAAAGSAAASTASASSPAEPAASTAAEWLSHAPLDADVIVIDEVVHAPARLRVDVGRFGMAAVSWALATAGVPRTVIARRALDEPQRAAAVEAVTTALAASSSSIDAAGAVRAANAAARRPRASDPPRPWAVWLAIGPPSASAVPRERPIEPPPAR